MSLFGQKLHKYKKKEKNVYQITLKWMFQENSTHPTSVPALSQVRHALHKDILQHILEEWVWFGLQVQLDVNKWKNSRTDQRGSYLSERFFAFISLVVDRV